MTTPVCRQCNADTTLKRMGRTEGEDAGVRIVIDGISAMECANGHKRFPTPEFALQFIERVMNTGKLVTAEPAVEKGFFRKRAHCPGCGQAMPEKTDGASCNEVSVDLPETGPASVELSVPIFNCAGCKQEVTLPSATVQRGVMQAMANAFRAADITPG